MRWMAALWIACMAGCSSDSGPDCPMAACGETATITTTASTGGNFIANVTVCVTHPGATEALCGTALRRDPAAPLVGDITGQVLSTLDGDTITIEVQLPLGDTSNTYADGDEWAVYTNTGDGSPVTAAGFSATYTVEPEGCPVCRAATFTELP